MIDKRDLPDVSEIDQRRQYSPIDWVGMNAIRLPTRLRDSLLGERPVEASIQAYVNLENTASRGIHMSRLFLQLDRQLAEKTLDRPSLITALDAFLESHQGLSSHAFLELAFDYLVKRPALKSDNSGWKSYATTLTASRRHGKTTVELMVEVLYSSTCPCSAALARQLIRSAFTERFGASGKVDASAMLAFLDSTDGIVATPHSQRSVAQVKVRLDGTEPTFPLTQLIDQIETALATPVQTAVKREDEQEFARLNGQNLMFCEDAARRLKDALDADAAYADYWLRVNHLESLHAHDAVAITTKGIKDGYPPLPGPGITR